MPQQAEAGDVRQCVSAGLGQNDARHRRLSVVITAIASAMAPPSILVSLGGRRDDPQTQRLGQDQEVARLRTGVGDDGSRMHSPDDRQAEDRLLRLDRVPADDRDAGFARLLGRPAEDLREHLRRQGSARESRQARAPPAACRPSRTRRSSALAAATAPKS